MIDTIKYYFYYLDSIFIGYAPIIRATMFMVYLLFTIYFSAIVSLLFIQRKRKNKIKRYDRYKKSYESNLREVIFSENDIKREDIISKIDIPIKDNKKKWQKEVLTKLVLFIADIYNQSNHTQEMNLNNYSETVSILELESYWLKQLSSSRLKRKKRAVRKLDDLTGSIVTGNLARLTNTPNPFLRKLARIEFIKSKGDDAYKFLKEGFDPSFNNFDAIRIHNALKEKSQNERLPLMISWVKNTKNEDFIIFLIKEIGFFEQSESAPYLLEMFKESESQRKKAEIVRSLTKIKYEPALDIINNKFMLASSILQDSIINAMGVMGNKKTISTLKEYQEIVHTNKSKEEIKKAIKLIKDKYNINSEIYNTEESSDFQVSINN